jgi:large subunit ribosomal protein L24
MQLKNPGKQRKKVFNAPAHIRHKLMAAPLSTELAASKGAKTLPVRKGDTVRIQRGDNKGFEGKVSRVDLKTYRIYIEGLTREKVDGTNIFLPVHPSKVEIRNLSLEDKYRKKILERKVAPEKKSEKPKAKPAKNAEKAPAKVEEAEAAAAPAEEVEQPETKEVATKKPAAKKAAKKPEEKEAAPKRAKKASVKGGE